MRTYISDKRHVLHVIPKAEKEAWIVSVHPGVVLLLGLCVLLGVLLILSH